MTITITNGQQAKGTKHGPDVSFVCADCGMTKPTQAQGGTGYAVDKADNLICYACCGKHDRRYMVATGKATLYLKTMPDGGTHRYGRATVTNWPGSLSFVGRYRVGSHNMAGKRYDAYFTGPDGHMWHGVTYGDNTQLCHCKRTKAKAQR